MHVVGVTGCRVDHVGSVEPHHEVDAVVQQHLADQLQLPDRLDDRDSVELFGQLVLADAVVRLVAEPQTALDRHSTSTQHAAQHVLDDVAVAVLEDRPVEDELFDRSEHFLFFEELQFVVLQAAQVVE